MTRPGLALNQSSTTRFRIRLAPCSSTIWDPSLSPTREGRSRTMS